MSEITSRVIFKMSVRTFSPSNAGGIGDDLFGQAIAEIFVAGIRAAIDEGEEDHGDLRAMRLAGCGDGTRGWGRRFLRRLPPEVVKFVADIARGLDALPRILLQTAVDYAGEIAGQFRAHIESSQPTKY